MFGDALVLTLDGITEYAVAHCGLAPDEAHAFKAWARHTNRLTLPTAAAMIIGDWVLQWEESYLGDWESPLDFARWWLDEIAATDGVAAALLPYADGEGLIQSLLEQGDLWLAPSATGFHFYAR